MIPTERTKPTFDIAKALHYIIFSKEYFEVILLSKGIQPKSRDMIKAYINKLDWIIRDLLTTIPQDSADLLRNELKSRDIASIDSILNMAIAMSEEQRLELEDYITEKYVNNGHREAI